MRSASMPAAGLTTEARRYAIWELARRAGVAMADFLRWRIEVGAAATTVFPQPGSPAQIRFPHFPEAHFRGLAPESLRSAAAAWMETPSPSILRWVPGFTLPFVPPEFASGQPLFHRIDRLGIECSLDLPAVTLMTLSRAEEFLNPQRDSLGRFPAWSGISHRDGFLHRPVVDEYGLALEQALQSLMPGRKPAPRPLRCKISHDIDRIGIPFRLQSSVGHAIRRHRPQDTLRDLVGSPLGWEPTWLRCVRSIAREVQRRGFRSAVYWKASPCTEWDTGYDPNDRRIRRVIEDLTADGVEHGVHPGFHTFEDLDRLAAEARTIREVTGQKSLGGRQHYLRWSPLSWTHWEECGLVYDSTVGYPECVGFRAGTSYPYYPWLFDRNRPARVLEIPLLIMDVSLTACHGGRRDRIRAAAEDLIHRCRTVGGVVSLLWHNSEYNDPLMHRVCMGILDQLDGASSFDWASEPAPPVCA